MSIEQHCLDNIIGLSRTTCNCFTSGKPYDVSKSALWLDELDGINLNIADSIKDCEQGSLWDLMDKARDNAIEAFKSDLMAALLTKYRYKRQPFSGVIGSQKFTKNIDLTQAYYGVRIYSANIIGGIMSVKRIGLIFDSNATFNIYVYDEFNDSPIATYAVNAIANQLTWFNIPAPLNLDMNNYGNGNPNYWIVYQKASFKPKDISGGCGCGPSVYKYYWNTKEPRYISYEKDRWSEYIMITGTSGDATSAVSRNDSWSTANYLYGLMLDVDFKCKVQDLICLNEMDFESNALAKVMAYAVRYKAGELLIDSILASGQINRFTMTDRERLMGKKNTYVKEYQSRISWLTENINYTSNDCLICNDFDDLLKIGIFS